MTSTLIRLVGLGGTIAMSAGATGALEPRRGAADLGAMLPTADLANVRVVAEDFRKVPGASLSIADAVALAARIRELVDDGADGVVVTQGTDTLEEVSFVAELLLDTGDVPVVFTGAMVPPHLPGSDATTNLRDAVAVAAAGRSFGGVVAVFGGQILPVRHVQKRHTVSQGAFTSSYGTLGEITEGVARQRGSLPPRPRLTIGPDDQLPYVHLHRTALGDDGRVFGALLAHDARGLVVEAFGAGHLSQSCVPALQEIAAAIPTVLVSRTGAGFGLRQTYGFPGSERDLLSHGLIWGGDLDGLKSRLLLTLLLAADHDRHGVSESFAGWAG